MATAVFGVVEEFDCELQPIGHTPAQEHHARLVAEGAHVVSVAVGALDTRVVGRVPVVAGRLVARSVPHHQYVQRTDGPMVAGQPQQRRWMCAAAEAMKTTRGGLGRFDVGADDGVRGELGDSHDVAAQRRKHPYRAIGQREVPDRHVGQDGRERVWGGTRHAADDTVRCMTAPLAITMGDPSGIGPEIVLRSWVQGELGDGVVVYGDGAILRHGAQLLGLEVDWASFPLVDLGLLTAADHRPGVLDAASGAAARAYVERATIDALASVVSGIVTMPMNKEATQLTDPSFVGHTEFIAGLCGVEKVTMMLTAATPSGSIAVTHVSTHCSLQQAIERVRAERVLDVVHLTSDVLRRFLQSPRIAVCGLNPHAGEHGLFGREDIDHIAPAVEAARAEGIDASGPHPADTVFFQAVHRDRYDAIVCMYHDQGHGPMKLLAFDTGVNVTLGLPIVRTSVDHGTAFDIAWQGIAFTDSVVHAVAYARKLVSA